MHVKVIKLNLHVQLMHLEILVFGMGRYVQILIHVVSYHILIIKNVEMQKVPVQ